MKYDTKNSFIYNDGIHGEQEYNIGDTVLIKAMNCDFIGKIISFDNSEIILKDKQEELFTTEIKSIFIIKRTY